MKHLGLVFWLVLAACSDGGPGTSDASAEPDLAHAPVTDGGVDFSEPPEDMALEPNGVTTLRVHYPAASHGMTIRGDAMPLDWSSGISMTKGADDTWTYTITLPASTAQVEWKPLLDDATWSRGPNYVARRGQTVDAYPHFYTVTGTTSQLFASFHSTTLGNDRGVWLYLPPSYDENPLATYPVLYMHDGQNIFDTTPAFGTTGWRVHDALNAGAEDGSIREIIVVAPESTADRDYEYTPTSDPAEGKSGGGDAYLKMLVEELKPQVDAMLRTRPGRQTTGIMGSSLGGLISSYAGTTHAGTFGLVGALSPSTWWDNLVLLDDVKATGVLRPDRVYANCGDSDDGLDETQQLFDAYLSIGYVAGKNFSSVVQPGGQHSEVYWAMRVPGALAFLFGPRTP